MPNSEIAALILDQSNTSSPLKIARNDKSEDNPPVSVSASVIFGDEEDNINP